MKTPWWAWIAVGIPVLIVSSIMDIMIFVIVGAVFTIIGTAKLIYLFVLSPRVSTHQVVEQQLSKRRCPRCHVPVGENDFFCRLCGQGLR